MPKSLVDLKEDLADLAKEAANLRQQIELYKLDAISPNIARELLSKSGLASNTTKLYTGCEQIMEYLAKVIDKAPAGHIGGGWHAHLLKRMSQPYLNVRGRIISKALFDELDRLRGFRHRERTSYGRQLDGPIVAERAKEMADAAGLFVTEVTAFMRAYVEPNGDGG